MLILQVKYNKANDQKYITIPKRTNINAGDYVRIVLIDSEEEAVTVDRIEIA